MENLNNMYSARRTFRPLLANLIAAAIVMAAITGLSGCNSNSEGIGSYLSANKADCLPDLALTDQHGQKLTLASLKGKPVLFDFFYTSCPGPCLMLTARMRWIASHLGSALGSNVSFVSVSVDPEHDNPSRLLEYAKEQGANRAGWYFLTGPPDQVERVMSRFGLKRQRESDGSVDHVLEFFLVGADGHLLYQYLASQVDPARIAGDIEQAAEGHKLANAATDSVRRFSIASLREPGITRKTPRRAALTGSAMRPYTQIALGNSDLSWGQG
ncbi:MAG TPA: SCO family protein [Candidatus Binataceae bacterium]|nr:SCO family protein [Candidatus Binataceae bacterium]